jgi:hypothetical protein
MSSWLILAIAMIYLVIAFDLLIKGQTSMGITFIGFCLGNFGLYLQT